MSDFSPNHRSSFVRADGTEIEVAMTIDCEGHPLPWYMTDHVATLADGTIVELTEAEIEQLDEQLADSPPER